MSQLLSKEQNSKEFELPSPVKFEQGDARECVVCVQKTLETYDIYTTQTIESGTLLHTFLSKYSDNEYPFTPTVNKYICSMCLQLVNVLENAELQYFKLKCSFEAIIIKNPIFRTLQSIRFVCKEEGTLQGGECNDTGLYSGDDSEATAPAVVVKIEHNSDEDNRGLEHLVHTVMETDPTDEDLSFPEENRDGTAPAFKLESLQGEDISCIDFKPNECQVSHRRFAQDLLGDDEIIYTGQKMYQCQTCFRSYNQKGYLQNHMKRFHTVTMLFRCRYCPEVFVNISKLHDHIKKHKDLNVKIATVSSIERKDMYHRHLKTHSVEKARSFECPICEKRFFQKTHLKYHLATHSGEKPFLCTVCQCWFNREGNLQRHMKLHTGEKQHKCDVCGQRFSQKTHLQKHFRRKHMNPVESKHTENKQKRKEGSLRAIKSENRPKDVDIKEEIKTIKEADNL